jgi:glycine/D-amino acid oxidase-like deaminating enzyme
VPANPDFTPTQFALDDIDADSLNLVDEGYFDAPTMLRWQQQKTREKGVEYVQNEVVAINHSASRVETMLLKSGQTIGAGTLVNATGPRARLVANMAGIEAPIEPRRRYTYIFSAKRPLDRDLPLTIDPTGVHFRQEGDNYLVGCPPMIGDPGIDYDDFGFEDGV